MNIILDICIYVLSVQPKLHEHRFTASFLQSCSFTSEGCREAGLGCSDPTSVATAAIQPSGDKGTESVVWWMGG